MTVIVEAFRLGEQVAIAFPPEFGIKPGQKFNIKKVKDMLILSPTI